jgi:hypothetical protein
MSPTGFQGINHQSRLFRQDPRGDPLNPTGHLLRRSPGKGEEHDPTRINARNNQMGHAMGERVCLARTGPGNDEQRLSILDRVLHRAALFRVKRNEMRIGHRFGIESQDSIGKHAFQSSANWSGRHNATKTIYPMHSQL